MARNGRTDPVDESRLSGFERKCCEHVGEANQPLSDYIVISIT
jgi:hypothetical protein